MVRVPLRNYAKLIGARLPLIQKKTTENSRRIAKFVVREARRLAPKLTGETKRGIRIRRIGKIYQAESRVTAKNSKNYNYGFRQNLWANQTPPFDKPTMRWNGGKPTLYGTGKAKYTGKPRFFDIAKKKAEKRFNVLLKNNTSKALRA